MLHAIKKAAAETAADKVKARGFGVEEGKFRAKLPSSLTPQDRRRPASDEGNRDKRSCVVTRDEESRGSKHGMIKIFEGAEPFHRINVDFDRGGSEAAGLTKKQMSEGADQDRNARSGRPPKMSKGRQLRPKGKG